MGKSIMELSVFISCPSNLSEIRSVAEAAIEETSNVLGTTQSVRLIPISWKNNIVPGVATDSQEVINKQTLKRYDIYLGMIGSRFGTPTPRAGSGTEEEFDLALTQFRNDPSSIRILFYLQAFGVNPFDLQPPELQKVLDFRTKLQEQGVLYKELDDLDDALASIKNHLLQLVSTEWDQATKKWKEVGGHSVPDIRNVLQNHKIIGIQNFSIAVEEAPSEELGIIELQMIGTQELASAGASISKLASNLDLLTEKTQSKFDNFTFDPSLGMAGAQQLIDRYASDIDEFVTSSRGELANARFHLSKGADSIESFYQEMKAVNITLGESASDLIRVVEGIEPSIKQFRDVSLTAKQAVEHLAPLTRKFKTSRNGLITFFDQVALEMTLSIERLSLLKVRLSDSQ